MEITELIALLVARVAPVVIAQIAKWREMGTTHVTAAEVAILLAKLDTPFDALRDVVPPAGGGS